MNNEIVLFEEAREKVRKPLPEWEEVRKTLPNWDQVEDRRVYQCCGRIHDMANICNNINSNTSVEKIEREIKSLKNIMDLDWKEFSDKADDVYHSNLTSLNEHLAAAR